MRDYSAGEVLCREGQVEDVFYIIVSGQVEVSQVVDLTERRALKTLSSPGYFGEMALIQSVPRSATVSTLEPTTVLEIDQPSFDAVLRRSPVMAMAMLREVIGRLQFNDEKTIANLRREDRGGEGGRGGERNHVPSRPAGYVDVGRLR